ncbi:MAG: restriction endonuclease subunit S [Caldisericales bacterium]|nr:restriction endonuclease subunit S [Caldisericales bacterium]
MSFSEWVNCNLGEIASFKTGKLNSNAAETNGIYPFFTCSPETFSINSFAFDCEAVILAGNNANGVFSLKYHNGKFNAYQRTYVITTKPLIADVKFIYYQLDLQLNRLKNVSHGTATKYLTLPLLNEIKIILPPLPTQRRIAEILSALDDKIELNRQTNATLEAIAQDIFKEWFVDFNFPGATGEMVESELGMIPKGWKILPMDKIADFLNGLALQKYPAENDYDYLPVIKIREMKNGITDSSDKASKNLPAKYIVHDGDLLFSWSGSLEIIFWVGGDGALNQHLFKVTSNNYPIWFCYFWILQYIDKFKGIAEDKTTTMGHIQRHHISEALCLIPDKLENIDKVMNPIIEKIINNKKEVILLAKIRDALLPKLMSGEIEM